MSSSAHVAFPSIPASRFYSKSNMPRYGIRRGRGSLRSTRRTTSFKRGGTRARYARRPPARSGQGITEQFDRKLIYRYKRMPRYKKRRWIKSKRRFTAHLASSVGTRQVIFNGAIANEISNTVQGFISTALLGYKGAADNTTYRTGFSDMSRLIANDQTGGQINNGLSGNLLITSAILDTTFHNTGEKKLEVDLYEIYCVGNKAVDQPDLAVLLNDYNLITQDGVGTAPNLEQRGVTPFECPRLAPNGLKIMKKTKYFVGAGEVFTYQMRDPRNHWMSLRQFSESDATEAAFKGGMTKCLLAVIKQVAGSGSGNSGFTWGTTRIYRYKIVQSYGQAGEYNAP